MRIMSYNIHSGKNMDGKLDIAAISEVISDLAPDICALNEVRMRTSDVHGLELASVIGEHVGMDWRFGRAIDIAGGEYGNAILSRFPILSSRVVPVAQLPPEEQEKWYEPRSALEVVVQSLSGPVQVVTCHFGLNRREQEEAVKTVLPMLRADIPSLFMGDLNVSPRSDLIAALRAVIRDTAEDLPLTYPARGANVKIDYIFASDHFRCGACRTVQTLASDHLPIFADVQL